MEERDSPLVNGWQETRYLPPHSQEPGKKRTRVEKGGLEGTMSSWKEQNKGKKGQEMVQGWGGGEWDQGGFLARDPKKRRMGKGEKN